MNVQDYLRLIGYTHNTSINATTLRGLQRAHMLTVPFENLDIPLSRKIQLEEQALWNKIVLNKRGGFCYELNGLFAWLLREIGFNVTYLNARVYNREGQRGIDFDHLTLLVGIPDESTRWLADVGFGDSFLEPLRFDFNGEQAEGLRAYRLEPVEDGFDMWQRNYEGQWQKQYFFDLKPHDFPSEYEAACEYQQTSPESSFSHKQVISLPTPNGRKTISDDKFIVTTNGQREERNITEEEKAFLLKEHFGVVV
jgi:N-hydroxyarylamine O-acetyltransferase